MQQVGSRGGQHAGIEWCHCAGWLQLRQQFADPAMRPAQYRPPHRQGFDHSAAEGLGLARQLQHQVTGRVGLGHLRGRRGEGHRRIHAQHTRLRLEFLDIGLAPGLARARKPQPRVWEGTGAQRGQQLQRVGIALEPGAAPGQQQ